MVEQYIYSRSEKESAANPANKVSLGYGYMALSPHMTEMLKSDAREHSAEYLGGELRDTDGTAPSIYRKVMLEHSGKLLLMCSTPFGSRDEAGRQRRGFHVTHGYIVDGDDMNDPVRWFKLNYYQSDPNQEEEPLSLPGASCISALPAGQLTRFNLGRLADGMGALGISQETFTQMVMVCFDALTSNRRLLIAYDDQEPDREELKKKVLCWLYICLPFALRRQLGADSEYTYKASPQTIQVAFVPLRRIAREQGQYMIALDEKVPLKGDYLVLNGVIQHSSSYSSKWYGKVSLFSRWIARVIDAFWNECDDKESIVGLIRELSDIYGWFDEQLEQLPAAKAPDPALYNALCWMQLSEKSQDPLMREVNRSVVVTEEEELTCQMTLMDRMASGDNVSALLDRELERHTVPARDVDLDLLVTALRSEEKERAAHILSAFMVADTEEPGAEISRVMERYQAKLPAGDAAFRTMLGGFFFGDAMFENDWRSIRVDPSATAAARRRTLWERNRLDLGAGLRKLPDTISAIVQQIPLPVGVDGNRLLEECLAQAEVWSAERYPAPTLQQITDLAEGVQPYLYTSARNAYIHLLCTTAERYTSNPYTAGLENLELLQKAFSPLKGDKNAFSCWEKLFRDELRELCKSGNDPEINDQLLPRWRALLQNGPIQEKDVKESILGHVYDEMLVNPRPFMKAVWLEQQLSTDSMLNNDSQRALGLLCNFAKSSSKTVKTWAAMKKKMSAKVGKKACAALPQFFAAGLLPGVEKTFLSYILHLQPEEAGAVLKQAAVQGGSKLIKDTLTVTKQYERLLPEFQTTDLEFLLKKVSADTTLLATLDQLDGKPEFENWFADSICKWVKSKDITLSAAEKMIADIKQHCRENNYQKTTAKIDKTFQKLKGEV